jgi:hypothetical protein
MRSNKKSLLSRREFARDVAVIATVAAIAPSSVVAQTEKSATPLKPLPEEEGLSVQAKAEAEMNNRALLEKYSDRLDDAQKKDVRRLLMQQQKSIETLRGFALVNADEPALVLHLELPEAR